MFVINHNIAKLHLEGRVVWPVGQVGSYHSSGCGPCRPRLVRVESSVHLELMPDFLAEPMEKDDEHCELKSPKFYSV